MSLTLAAILAESATRHPDRDAVVIGPRRITYGSSGSRPAGTRRCCGRRASARVTGSRC